MSSPNLDHKPNNKILSIVKSDKGNNTNSALAKSGVLQHVSLLMKRFKFCDMCKFELAAEPIRSSVVYWSPIG